MSEVNEMTGKVVHVGETESFPSGFQKRLVVIESVDGQYTNQYGFELHKDKCDLASGISIGEDVSVKFNLGRCREYNGKWFGSMHTCWNIKSLGGGQAEVPSADHGANDLQTGDEELDIPF